MKDRNVKDHIQIPNDLAMQGEKVNTRNRRLPSQVTHFQIWTLLKELQTI